METKTEITPQMINAAITAEMINATKAVFEAKTKTEVIRKIVEKYQLEIIKKMKPINQHTKKLITSVKDAYDMNDKDFEKYMQLCQEAQKKAGLKTEHVDHCPLLVAKSEQRKKERALLTLVLPIFKLDINKLICSLENYEKMLDITLRWLAPQVKL